jgi:hypothetical protein
MTIVPILVLAFVYVMLPVAVSTYQTLRGVQVVTCPATHARTAIEVDELHAAFTSVLGPTDLVVADCAEWPDRAGCGQECVAQVHVAGRCTGDAPA